MIPEALVGWAVLAVVLSVVLSRQFRQAREEERRRRLEGWRREALLLERDAEALEAILANLARHIREERRIGPRRSTAAAEERILVAPAEWHPGLRLYAAFRGEGGRA